MEGPLRRRKSPTRPCPCATLLCTNSSCQRISPGPSLRLPQAGQLYASGCRVSALRLYNNSRTLADRSLLLLPAWLARAGPSSATAAVLAASLTRHLNTICRHVLLPHQLARLTRDLAHLVPQLPSGLERLTSHVTTARSSTHLLSLPQAAHELQAATVLAQQLFPVVAAATRVPGDIAGSEAEGCSGRENGEPGSASGAVSKGQGGKGKGRAEDGQANGAGEAAVGRLVFRQADVAGLQPQVRHAQARTAQWCRTPPCQTHPLPGLVRVPQSCALPARQRADVCVSSTCRWRRSCWLTRSWRPRSSAPLTPRRCSSASWTSSPPPPSTPPPTSPLRACSWATCCCAWAAARWRLPYSTRQRLPYSRGCTGRRTSAWGARCWRRPGAARSCRRPSGSSSL